MLVTHMLRTALLLGLFAIVGTGLVALTFKYTEHPIAESERDALLRSLHALVPSGSHDNDMFNDVLTISNREHLGSDMPMRIFRARKQGQPVAVVIEAVAPDGYSGNIFLLVAIKHDATLLGVRVGKHKETPGLGDDIEIERSDWINSFVGKSLSNPDVSGWQVKKDGGEFDQFTGATITPRAVVKAVYKALMFYQAQGDMLFVEGKQHG